MLIEEDIRKWRLMVRVESSASLLPRSYRICTRYYCFCALRLAADSVIFLKCGRVRLSRRLRSSLGAHLRRCQCGLLPNWRVSIELSSLCSYRFSLFIRRASLPVMPTDFVRYLHRYSIQDAAAHIQSLYAEPTHWRPTASYSSEPFTQPPILHACVMPLCFAQQAANP